jgi:uncharacterized lipoprotein YbaY
VKHSRLARAAVIGILASACSKPAGEPAQTPAPARPEQPAQPSFVSKVWISTDAAAAAGTMRIFLPDGTLVMDSCVETYRLAQWTSIDAGRVVWTEDAARIEAEIVRAAPEELQLRLRLVDGSKEENYRLAKVPYVCPDTRETSERRPQSGNQPGSVVRIDGTLIYLERIALPPSARINVELRDTARADAPARPLATQSMPATSGPPFRFSLSLPQSSIDPRAELSVFAEIRDGERVLFATDSRQPVPRDGQTGKEIRLKFVAGARGR